MLLVTLVVVFTQPVSAASYAGPCEDSDAPAGNNLRAYGYHADNRKDIKNMAAHITFLSTVAGTCSGTHGVTAPMSVVLPVNMQGGTIPYTVQLGYGIINGGALDFYYTENDDDGTLMPEPDINGVAHAKPQLGDNYTFRIISVAGAIGEWEYQIVDNSVNTTATWYGNAHSSSPYAETSWSGFEVDYNGDALGGYGTLGEIDISTICMRYTDNSVSYYTGSTIYPCCGSYPSDIPDGVWNPLCLLGPSWHITASHDGSGNEVVSGYTAAH